MSRVKSLAKEAAKTSVKASNKKTTGRPKLYTDEERKRLASLRSSKKYYEDKIKNPKPSTSVVTLASIRPFLSADTARELAYQGFFDAENSDKYYGMDFRDWFREIENSFIEKTLYQGSVTRSLELQIHDELRAQNYYLDDYDYDDTIENFNKLSSIEDEISNIQTGAKTRRNEVIAQEVARKNNIKNGEALIDTLDETSKFISKLSNPEKAAVQYIKDKLAESVVRNIDLENATDIENNIFKSSVRTAISKNPKEGIKQAITETVVESVKEKYGDAAASVVPSLVNLATGSGSVKTVGLALFEGVVSKSGLNKALMAERADELISMGESTSDDENLKMLGRDVLVDIGKDIITSGGNIYAAIPMIVKDVLLDTGKAGLRKAKQELNK